MKLHRIAQGLYETQDGRHLIEQDIEGNWGATTDWWIHFDGRNLVGPFARLRDAREELS